MFLLSIPSEARRASDHARATTPCREVQVQAVVQEVDFVWEPAVAQSIQFHRGRWLQARRANVRVRVTILYLGEQVRVELRAYSELWEIDPRKSRECSALPRAQRLRGESA